MFQRLKEKGNHIITTRIEHPSMLKAMGVKERVGKGAVRFSLGRYTTKSEIDTTVQLLKSVLKP